MSIYADKNDKKDNKPQFRYISPLFLKHTAYPMMAGAKKYEEYNYLKGHMKEQLIEAAIRHLFAVLNGEELDKECTDLLGIDVTHLGCAAANINIVFAQIEAGTSLSELTSPKEKAEKLRSSSMFNALVKEALK